MPSIEVIQRQTRSGEEARSELNVSSTGPMVRLCVLPELLANGRAIDDPKPRAIFLPPSNLGTERAIRVTA